MKTELPPGPGDIWARCAPVDLLVQSWSVAVDLRAAGIDPAAVAALDLARVLPAGPAARDLPELAQAWLDDGRRLMLPLFDPAGGLLPVAFSRTVERWDPPPAGLLLACPIARRILAGEDLGWWRTAADERPDWLITASPVSFLRLATLRTWTIPPAVLGVVGAWPAGIGAKIHRGARVSILTGQEPDQVDQGEAIRRGLAA